MSEDGGNPVTVSTDDLTVEKRLDTEGFQTLAVVFELTSDRSAPARVQLVDEIPESIPMDDVGFHPDYGGEHWSIQDRRVVFERTLSPESDPIITIFGVRGIEAEEAGELLLDRPTLELLDGTPDPDAVTEADRSNAVREFLSGETDSLPGLDPEDIGESGEEIEAEGDPSIEAEEPPVEAAEAPEEPAESDGPATSASSGDATGEPSAPVSGGVARVLANELREGKASAEDRETIADALAPTPGSTEARLEHLQSRVSELDAYTGALEDFLDEGGTADLVEELLGRLDELDDGLEETDRTITEVTDRFEAIEEQFAALSSDHERFETAIDRIDPLDESINQLESEVADLQDDLDDLATFRERLSSVFGAAGDPTADAVDEAGSDEYDG